MVNADVVNARISYFSPAAFREFFPVFGPNSTTPNPFKYICNSRINHRTVHSPRRPARRHRKVLHNINGLASS